MSAVTGRVLVVHILLIDHDHTHSCCQYLTWATCL